MRREAVSGIVIALLLTSMQIVASNIQPTKASGTTVYIRPDGSVDPPAVPIQRIGDTYGFSDNIYNMSIEIQRDNIVLDGNGRLLQGSTYLYYGIYLFCVHGVTVTNVIVSGFTQDICLDSSSHNEIINNTVLSAGSCGIGLSQSTYNVLAGNVARNNYEGIALYESECNILSENNAAENRLGISLLFGTNNTMRNNAMAANKYNFELGYFYLQFYLQDIDESNTVDGKPIYYWINRHDETVPLDAGFVAIVNSSRITVRDLELRNNVDAVSLAYTRDSLIENVTATDNAGGIWLDYSDSNIITENNVTYSDSGGGISLDVSAYNYVTDNYVSNTNSSGIWLEDTSYNTVIGNTVVSSVGSGSGQEFDGAGVLIDDSGSCNVSDNTLIENNYGIDVLGGWPNFITQNNVKGSVVGLLLDDAFDNSIYHNNFVECKRKGAQVGYLFLPSRNTLDNGNSGNYWSDYRGSDANNDGIGDTPYVIDEVDQDRFPFMSPYGGPALPTYTLSIAAAANGTTDPLLGNYRHSRGQNIPVRAIPDSGFALDHWMLDDVNIGSTNPVDVEMNSNCSLLAVFSPAYSVTIWAHCNAEGADVEADMMMDALPSGYTTPATFTGLLGTHNFTVSLHDANGHLFKQWDTGETGTTITASSTGSHTAYFDVKYSLTVASTTGGTTDPASGTQSFWSGTIISVVALPDAGYYLDYWLLDGVNIGAPPGPMSIDMTTNHSLVAMFKQLSPGHDVAIRRISSKTVVGQGFSSQVEVTAMNVGSYTETFNVTLFVNTTSVALQTVTLASGAFAIIDLAWNTTGFTKGSYSLSAYAGPLEDEVDTSNNNRTDGYVVVSMIGDLNGGGATIWDFIPDGKCNIVDVSVVAKCFGSHLGAPPPLIWNVNCDVTGFTPGVPDDKVNILDVSLVARHFGEHSP